MMMISHVNHLFFRSVYGALNVTRDAYGRTLSQHPLLTQMSTSGCLWGLGDLATQHIEERQQRQRRDEGIDWRRTWNQTVYAALIWGPMGHAWYPMLDRFVRRLAFLETSQCYRRVALKYCVEAFLHDPISLAVYFSTVGYLGGESWTQICAQMKRDYVPTLALGFVYWAPLDILNFAIVPVRHQLLMVNFGCFLDSVVLSHIKKNGFDWRSFIGQ